MAKKKEITCVNTGGPMSEDLAARLYRYLVECNLKRLGLTADITVRKKTEAEIKMEAGSA